MNEFERQTEGLHAKQKRALWDGDKSTLDAVNAELDFVVSERNPNFTRERLAAYQESQRQAPLVDKVSELTEEEAIIYSGLIPRWHLIIDRTPEDKIDDEILAGFVEALVSSGTVKTIERATELCQLSFMEAKMEQTE